MLNSKKKTTTEIETSVSFLYCPFTLIFVKRGTKEDVESIKNEYTNLKSKLS